MLGSIKILPGACYRAGLFLGTSHIAALLKEVVLSWGFMGDAFPTPPPPVFLSSFVICKSGCCNSRRLKRSQLGVAIGRADMVSIHRKGLGNVWVESAMFTHISFVSLRREACRNGVLGRIAKSQNLPGASLCWWMGSTGQIQTRGSSGLHRAWPSEKPGGKPSL